MKSAELLNYFKYQAELKSVYRQNNIEDRAESSAEHSWSVAMIAWLIAESIQADEGIQLNLEKALKMALIHDLVEINAGDVSAWDEEARENIKEPEIEAIKSIQQNFLNNSGISFEELWLEHDKLETLESKIVKAADQLCPLITRVVNVDSYKGKGVDRQKLDSMFLPIVSFSDLTKDLYNMLADEIGMLGLFDKV